VNQAGEGWLLPGEIIAMAESGIRNIISLQPFGCIANHVVAKGISSKLSRLYPDLNFLNLDMDAGNSDVNLQNRLDFFIHSAKAHDRPEFSSQPVFTR
jgi:predicted nucleotide-binding protein (sugar kinase/HSP70/actin superfamily)